MPIQVPTTLIDSFLKKYVEISPEQPRSSRQDFMDRMLSRAFTGEGFLPQQKPGKVPRYYYTHRKKCARKIKKHIFRNFL